ncbi:1-acyl-sn-glycerol-3-phosphate acyltransferase delta isoform X3 [Eptesicus fuscus]|uniref:1-acyl-sn-glycerol-3-phosphate acyltransferase delta isoform X3 n=1 Tax=Eptesicus fuscus TaxID=29078 RepID=UPI0024040512|nr:1-acyl-sn-glycerol-3-phosphate acyltransferase delta isoform X3 [Eptesicus fuscus]
MGGERRQPGPLLPEGPTPWAEPALPGAGGPQPRKWSRPRARPPSRRRRSTCGAAGGRRSEPGPASSGRTRGRGGSEGAAAMDLVGLLKSQFLCHLVFCYVFIASGLIVNTLQLLTLPLWPIDKQLFRRLNCRLSYCVSSQLVMLLEWWSGTECVIYTDPRAYPTFGKENAIVVLNHKFEIDFLCGWSLAERFGVLGGSKVLAKKELAYVPIIGWMWYFTEMVFCTRKWEQDRKTVSQSLLRLRDYPEKYFFLIHCEGTRFTEKKHQISMQVAQAKGLPGLKHHLLPRTKGFAVTVRSLRNVETMKTPPCWAS